MKNILFITCWFPYPQKPWKSYFIKEHALAISKQNYNIKVFHINLVEGKTLFKYEIFERQTELDELELRITSRFNKKLYGLLPIVYNFIPGIKKIHNKLFKEFNPDLLHANVVFQAGVITRLIAKKHQKSYIITEHLSGIPGLIKNPLFKYFIKKAQKEAEVITTVSDFHRDQLLKTKELDLDSQKLVVVPNVVRPHTKSDLTIDYPADPDKCNFLMVANLTIKKHQPKRPDLVVKALAKVKEKLDKDIRLVLIGGGERVKFYEDICYKNDIELVQTGFIQKEYVYEYYKQTDYFLHASEIETFSLVVAEALLFGIPCLASNKAALKERIEPFSGLLVENTVEAWADGILKLIQTPWDREKIKNHYKNLYTPDSVGIAFDRLYKSLNLK
ncbi:MAG: glycosyltransferase family 4 protein [Bacteroidales bacterium]|nr:glycosyltransferase family 4 protein [Bacteroidales bacterium]MCF8327564.1 glycosyltransferase family 4 protein [Bacteroidales bacterium]